MGSQTFDEKAIVDDCSDEASLPDWKLIGALDECSGLISFVFKCVLSWIPRNSNEVGHLTFKL